MTEKTTLTPNISNEQAMAYLLNQVDNLKMTDEDLDLYLQRISYIHGAANAFFLAGIIGDDQRHQVFDQADAVPAPLFKATAVQS